MWVVAVTILDGGDSSCELFHASSEAECVMLVGKHLFGRGRLYPEDLGVDMIGRFGDWIPGGVAEEVLEEELTNVPTLGALCALLPQPESCSTRTILTYKEVDSRL